MLSPIAHTESIPPATHLFQVNISHYMSTSKRPKLHTQSSTLAKQTCSGNLSFTLQLKAIIPPPLYRQVLVNDNCGHTQTALDTTHFQILLLYLECNVYRNAGRRIRIMNVIDKVTVGEAITAKVAEACSASLLHWIPAV